MHCSDLRHVLIPPRNVPPVRTAPDARTRAEQQMETLVRAQSALYFLDAVPGTPSHRIARCAELSAGDVVQVAPAGPASASEEADALCSEDNSLHCFLSARKLQRQKQVIRVRAANGAPGLPFPPPYGQADRVQPHSALSHDRSECGVGGIHLDGGDTF